MRCHSKNSAEGNAPVIVRTLGTTNKHTIGHPLLCAKMVNAWANELITSPCARGENALLAKWCQEVDLNHSIWFQSTTNRNLSNKYVFLPWLIETVTYTDTYVQSTLQGHWPLKSTYTVVDKGEMVCTTMHKYYFTQTKVCHTTSLVRGVPYKIVYC